MPSIPDFVYVEFSIEAGSKPQNCHLDVLNCSENGIGLLVPQKDVEILKTLDPGTVIPNMVFYAPWTLIQADATVRHLTRITTGRHNGEYVLGVESDEIVESSRVP